MKRYESMVAQQRAQNIQIGCVNLLTFIEREVRALDVVDTAMVQGYEAAEREFYELKDAHPNPARSGLTAREYREIRRVFEPVHGKLLEIHNTLVAPRLRRGG